MANAISIVEDWLKTNWTPANADGRTPRIDPITNFKRLDYRDAGSQVNDHILIYKSSGVAKGFGYTGIKYTDTVTVDCRSVWSSDTVAWQEHGQKLEDEILRILEGKKTRPGDDDIWDAMDPTSVIDLDDKQREFSKRIIEVGLLRSKEVTEL